ncbi:hypothetical protein SpCBS45565_g01715 [Spizellomyces sp. 'palustris']|nr:hypothetical protein SpCBS45565_g01715 [Spizellomyces sp. 'palustris']
MVVALHSFESFWGQVADNADATLLFILAHEGKIPVLCKRPSNEEKRRIRAGSVILYNEGDAHIKRWTDGRRWSPSRVRNRFFEYDESDGKLDRRTNNQYRDKGFKTVIHDGKEAVINSKGGYIKFRDKIPLTKRTASAKMNGSIWHLVSYYTKTDLRHGRLPRPYVVDHFQDTWNTLTSKGLPFEFVLDDTDPKHTADSDDENPSGSSQYFGDCSDNETKEPTPPSSPLLPTKTIQPSLLPDTDTDSLPLGDATKMGDLLWPYAEFESLQNPPFPFICTEPYMDPNPPTVPPTFFSDSYTCSCCTTHAMDKSVFPMLNAAPLYVDDTIRSDMLLTAPTNPTTLSWKRPYEDKMDVISDEEWYAKTLKVDIPRKRPYEETMDVNEEEWYAKKMKLDMPFETWQPIVATISFS